jgi:hypothetical protein
MESDNVAKLLDAKDEETIVLGKKLQTYFYGKQGSSYLKQELTAISIFVAHVMRSSDRRFSEEFLSRLNSIFHYVRD